VAVLRGWVRIWKYLGGNLRGRVRIWEYSGGNFKWMGEGCLWGVGDMEVFGWYLGGRFTGGDMVVRGRAGASPVIYARRLAVERVLCQVASCLLICGKFGFWRVFNLYLFGLV